MAAAQVCAHCLASTTDFSTQYERGRRFHFCRDVDACARRRGQWNNEPPVPPWPMRTSREGAQYGGA